MRLIRAVAAPVLWICALFAGAGTFAWTRGWLAVAVYTIGMSALGFIVRHFNAPLMAARAKPGAGTKPFDKIFLRALIPLVFIQAAVAGIDAVRFRWSSMPFAMAYAGAVLFALAIALIAWSMAVNPHAETTVRIQTDRGHTVIEAGPYRMVRHPMYVGAILMYVATPLMLGSLLAMAISGIMIALFVWRTAREDQTLRLELPGYAAYAARIRYRLVPGLW